MASCTLRTGIRILTVVLSLVLLVGATSVRACPLFLTETGRVKSQIVVPVPAQDFSRPLTSFTVRPQGGASPWVQSRLEKQIGFTPTPPHLRLGALTASNGVKAPRQVDLGVLKPTGKNNPDGTEIWVPDKDSVLSGRIEVDVRGDGLVVRQRVLRPVRAPGVQFAPLLKGLGRPAVQAQGVPVPPVSQDAKQSIRKESPSEAVAPLAVWLRLFLGKLQEIVATP